MTAIRMILVAALVAGITLFSVVNNQIVPVNFGFIAFNVWLPLLVIASFLLGFLPVWAWLSADKMLLKRKLSKAEATLGRVENELGQAKVELLRPPGAPMPPQAIPHPAPPPGT
jgi:uncharacterized membrane protein YciS (DUF1049 family)